MRFVFLLISLIVTSSVFAGVNLKNGNHYIAFKDDDFITRTCNSKTVHNGIFGFCWGTKYETFAVVNPDGCVVLQEHGGGGKTRFCPKQQVDPQAAAQKIVDVMRKKNNLSEVAAKEMVEKLSKNAELRNMYSRQYNVSTNLKAGTELYSNERGMQTLVVTDTGYTRRYNDGRYEEFNQEGQLTNIVAADGFSIGIAYKNGRIASIKNSRAESITFDWFANGKVKSTTKDGKNKVLYKYDGDNLVYNKDASGNEYGYEYDKNNNLTAVIYNPNPKKGEKTEKMLMEYDPKTQFVTKVTERNGQVTSYKYGNDPKNPEDHYWTEVTRPGFSGKPVTNKYEYEIKTKPDGARYTYRIYTKINGVETDTIYSECCSLPLKIKRGKHVTNFEYNEDGLLTKKTSTRGENIQITYHPKFKKITKVVNKDDWTTFKYDKKGNLELAENKDGKKVKLVYNSQGRITKMLEGEKKDKNKMRILSFKYNSMGKPVEIDMEKVGKIQVAYDNYGQIKKVESAQGHKMALQVTKAFQNLLKIVKPAGVNLNM